MWFVDIVDMWKFCSLPPSPGKNKRKISNIYKDFELYQVFMYNILCENVPIFPLYILLTMCRSHFGLRLSICFGLEVSGQFVTEISKEIYIYTNIQYIQRIFELYQLFMHNFQCKIIPKFAFYILFTYYSNYLLLEYPNAYFEC